MFVSFYFALNQDEYPESRKRPKPVYRIRFLAVLQYILARNHKLVMFSDDEEILKMCQGYASVTASKRSLDSFWAWSQRDAIRRSMQSRWKRFSTPEFFSPEYVALQLCKFQVLAEVSTTTFEPVVWIDAGLRDYMLPKSFKFLPSWKYGGIHATQFAPVAPCEQWVLELPGAFVMGGCFGGYGPDVRRLFQLSKALLQELWAQSKSANDQQVLSILAMRMPSFFHLQKAYTEWIPFIGSGNWKQVLLPMTSETKHVHSDFRWIVAIAIAVFVFLACHKNDSVAQISCV